MTPQERLANWKMYESQKGYFGHALYKAMYLNPDIWLVLPDLGFGLFDAHKEDFPKRIVMCGAAEQAAVGIAIGLAQEGKIPFIYTIPNFLIYRPYELIRDYVDHEKTPVKLVSGGRDKEYLEDGYTHQAEDMKKVLENFPNIKQLWPTDKLEVENMVKQMISDPSPYFLSLQRKA
jgi:transketolase